MVSSAMNLGQTGLLFFFANRSSYANGRVSGLRRRAFRPRIDRPRANLSPEITVRVVETFVLQRIAHDALNIETGLAERHCFSPFIELQRQTGAPLHDPPRSSVVGGRNVFNAAVLVDLIS